MVLGFIPGTIFLCCQDDEIVLDFNIERKHNEDIQANQRGHLRGQSTGSK